MYEPNASTATGVYPDFLEPVRELVRQHQELKHDRLRLAVYYAPPRRTKRDVFLFEVVDGFGADEVAPEGELFEFAYGSTPAFPLPAGASLQMTLTNPVEFRAAVRDGWRGIEQLIAARNADKATVVFADALGKRLWNLTK